MKRDVQQTLDFEPKPSVTSETQGQQQISGFKAVEDYDEREIQAVAKVQAIYRGIKGRRRFKDIIERAMDQTLNSFANQSQLTGMGGEREMKKKIVLQDGAIYTG